MNRRIVLLVLHVVLLVLAASSFTVVTGIGDGQFQWNYFEFSSRYGFGRAYQSSYDLATVLSYLAAYVVGAIVYWMVYRRSPFIALAGTLLCVVGFASFAFELSHWFLDHNRSWIASVPIALLVLASIAAIQEYQLPTQPGGALL